MQTTKSDRDRSGWITVALAGLALWLGVGRAFGAGPWCVSASGNGADGKLHGVAMVWSLSDQDPAPAGAIRGKWNFHPRFVIVDPATDSHPAKESATPTQTP